MFIDKIRQFSTINYDIRLSIGGEIMEEYEINLETLAIVPFKEDKSKVYESDKVFIVNKSVNKIMDSSCEYFGSSLNGRQKGTSKLIGITHKVPIIVEESRKIIFFPTISPRLKNCSWISLNNIDNIKKIDKGSSIIFNNNKILNISIPYSIIDNQILRASRLESVLNKRIENRKKL